MMNRRDFLQPTHLAQLTGQVRGVLNEPRRVTAAPRPPEVALLHFGRRAMATNFEVVLPFGTPAGLEIAEEALDLVDRLEDQLTVYRAHSEISRLNRDAADRPVALEERLYRLLAAAAQMSRDTDGAFDVTAGALIKAWGFFRRAGRVPSPEERTDVLQRVGHQRLEFDDQRRTVRYLRHGLEINLGSIGKGYALDRLADQLRREWELPAALLHGGFSSVYGLGSEPGDPRGWAVGLRHPWKAERRLVVLRLRDRGLATSAATFQNLEYQGRKLGHILDPRTGWPAEGLASATVTAPTAAEADALATAFFILGVAASQTYCTTHPEIGAVLLPAGRAARPVVLGRAVDEIDPSPLSN
jgi:thiamine biosynthesis lipoprotein